MQQSAFNVAFRNLQMYTDTSVCIFADISYSTNGFACQKVGNLVTLHSIVFVKCFCGLTFVLNHFNVLFLQNLRYNLHSLLTTWVTTATSLKKAVVQVVFCQYDDELENN